MKIVITSPVKHDGKDLEVNVEVDIKDVDAQALIAAGVAEAAQPKAAVKAAKAADPE